MEEQFDPNRTPFTRPAPGFRHYDTIHGRVTVNENSGIVQPIENGPAFPIEIPTEFIDFDQPFVHSCSPEKKDSGGMVLNKGCPAYNGCAIVQWFKAQKFRKPYNVIIERNGHVDSVRCFEAYVGMGPSGRPTSSVHYLWDGWRILMDRTTIPQKIKNADTGKWEQVETEVPELAPFYEEKKVGRFAVQGEPKKKRGRPRKAEVATPV